MRICALMMVALALMTSPASAAGETLDTAIFAGGCFWCVESDFDQVPGVVETTSGYIGGHVANPTYQEVAAKKTGHREAVRVRFDPSRVSYEELLSVFWHTVDPTDGGGQFCDRGEPYETAIFVLDDSQEQAAEKSKTVAEAALGQPLATDIRRASAFYPAEEYHQDYYTKNPLNYRFYRWSCGRNQRVKELWGKEAYKGVPGHG